MGEREKVISQTSPETGGISPVFAAVLRQHRDDFNRRFAAHSHPAAGIDVASFLTHLRQTLDPIVQRVAAIFPERTERVVQELYDLSLELFANGTLGPDARFPVVTVVWRQLLPLVPALIARDPTLVAASLSNAAFNVARQEGGRADFWLSQMGSLAPQCETTLQLFNCGQVLAWRSGMVQYRAAAIETALAMNTSLAAAALGLPATTAAAQLHATLARARSSPWESLEAADATVKPQLRLVGTIGDFLGFGGVFSRPPLVTWRDGALLAYDHQHHWQLLADCYGRLVHRIKLSDESVYRQQTNTILTSGPEKIEVDEAGRICWRQSSGTFADLTGIASAAGFQHTLALTLKDSHRVFLLAVV